MKVLGCRPSGNYSFSNLPMLHPGKQLPNCVAIKEQSSGPMRVRFADREVETITTLKDFKRVSDPITGAHQLMLHRTARHSSRATPVPRKFTH
jgi:hypothetical protein